MFTRRVVRPAGSARSRRRPVRRDDTPPEVPVATTSPAAYPGSSLPVGSPEVFVFRGAAYPIYSGAGKLNGKPFYPLNAPGMPVPGPDMIALARALGDDTEFAGKPNTSSWHIVRAGAVLERLVCEALYSSGSFVLPLSDKGETKKPVHIIAGHPWGRAASIRGPCPSEVFVLGKWLGEEEVGQARCFVGPSGALLKEYLEKFSLRPGAWYVTNLMKARPPEDADTLKQAWVAEFLPLLHQELRLVRPKYILCLGADAVKALLGRQATVGKVEGRAVEYTYPIGYVEGQDETHTALLLATQHPAAVLRRPELGQKMEQCVRRLSQLREGIRWDRAERGVDHFNVSTIEQLLQLEKRIDEECENNLLAVDAEWHGEHPQNAGSYVRTVQLSWKAKTAACIILRRCRGELSMRHEGEEPSEEAIRKAVAILSRITKDRRIAGHFFVADLEWLVPLGLDLWRNFRVARTWQRTRADALSDHPWGGFDTGIAGHAVDETDDFSLTAMALRYTEAPRYDHVLLEWKKKYCHEHKLKDEDLEGYGECPDEILHPEPGNSNPHYACYDADVVWRMVGTLQEKLSSDDYGHDCWKPFWITMRALPALFEMNTTGIPVDQNRLEQLTLCYLSARAKLERQIREWARWPELNLNSVYHIREFLFGEQYNGKEPAEPGGPPVRLRPKGARSLYLTPVLTTDKYPQEWSQLSVEERQTKTPSTARMSLAILARQSTRVRRRVNGRFRLVNLGRHVDRLRDYRFVSQVLKSVLREPVSAEDGTAKRDARGNLIYPGGLPAAVCDDGRVRSHGYPTKETGRWSFSRPPMQNFAKRRETDYKRILGDDYRWPLRTLLRAPEGHVLVSTDYKGAELFGMALLSGDQGMFEHVRRNLLPEYHPQFYDIHSSVAVTAFRYDCPPTKAGLKAIGKSHMRIVAKSVIFGVAYGRGANAIATAAREEGVEISASEAQKIIETIFEMYPGLVPFFEECRRRVSDPGWLRNAFGRFRRFPRRIEARSLGELQRQAMNFPVQGVVADAMTRAVDNLYWFRAEQKIPISRQYRLVLQVHDEVLAAVPCDRVAWYVDTVLPECMIRRVPIYPCRLDGTVVPGAEPEHLGIDAEVSVHWGEKLSPGECEQMGFSPKYAGWQETSLGWIDTEDSSRIWRGGRFVPPKKGEYEAAIAELVASLG